MDGVNHIRAELGHLPVLVYPVFLVHKISSTVGCKASSVSYTDKVGSEPIQLELLIRGYQKTPIFEIQCMPYLIPFLWS